MRTNIERWFLVLLLAANYISRIPYLWKQGAIGIPALGVGLIVSSSFIVLLLRSVAGAAAILAILGALQTLAAPLVRLLIWPRSESFPFLLSDGISLLACYCAFDLWSAWKKKADPVGTDNSGAAPRRV